MGNWGIVVPEDSLNYVENPSFEEGLAGGWGEYSPGVGAGTASKSDEWQASGKYSLKLVKSVPTDNWGYRYIVPDYSDFISGDYISFRFRYNVESGSASFHVNSVSTPEVYFISNVTGEGEFEVTIGPLTGNPTGIYISLYFKDGQTGTMYIDSVQVEKAQYSSTYFDGSKEGCKWVGIVNNSKSKRYAREAIGGRIYDLDDLEAYVEAHSGAGMAPIEILTQEQAILPGTLLRDYSVVSQSVLLNINLMGTSLANIHSLRDVFLDYIKPDRYGEYKPFYLQYKGANSNNPIYLPVVYESGLEGNTLDGYTDKISIRLTSPSAFWQRLTNRAYPLNMRQLLSSVNGIIGKEDGIWKELNSGLGGLSSSGGKIVKKGPDGRIYVGGDFTDADGVSQTENFAVWDPEAQEFTSLAGGDASGGVLTDIEFAPNGDIYVSGNFASFAGVSNTRAIAKWDVSAGAWVSVTPTTAIPSGDIQDIVIDQEGNVFVTGTFTQINGVSATNIAKMDTSGTWTALGTGLNNPGFTLAISPTNELYVGGVFTTADGVTVNYIAKWNGTTFETLSDGTIGITGTGVNIIMFHSNGELWIGGVFTQAGQISAKAIAIWNGQKFSPVGSGFDSATIYEMEEGDNGEVYVMGVFTQSGDGLQEFKNPVAVWNGSVWVHYDIILQSSGTIHDIEIIDDLFQYVVFPTAQDIATSDLTEITNEGSAIAYPVIEIKREEGTSAEIVFIENLTNKTRLWLDYSLQDGETLTIDLTPGKRSVVSSYFGQVWRAISQASNLSNFRLQPGTNDIKVLVEESGSPTVTGHVIIYPKYWSYDGVA